MLDNILFNKTPLTETIPHMNNPLSNLVKRKQQTWYVFFTTVNNTDKTSYFSDKLATVLG